MQQEKGLREVDGKIGYGTRKILGITHRLFDEQENYGVDYFPGEPFVGGAGDQYEIDPNDVRQGALGNCYFAAAMMAVAKANPSLIRKLIKSNGDGTYTITLYTEKGTEDFLVTPYFPAYRYSADVNLPAYAGYGDIQPNLAEIWPMLLEKAYAMHLETYGESEKGAGGYDLVGKGGNVGKAIKTLTGPTTPEYSEKHTYQMPDIHLVKD